MSTLEQALQGILNHLMRLQRPVVKLLQEGLTAEDIRIQFQDIPLHSADELIELYSWRNGTKSVAGDMLDDLHFFPGFFLMPLDRAIRTYRSFALCETWNPSWFPVFANGGGDFYAVQLSDKSAKTSEIVGFMLGEVRQEVEFESLLSMARTISACYDAGIYYVTDKGYLEADYEASMAVARQFNPTLDLYRS
jgi:hypothetical protein